VNRRIRNNPWLLCLLLSLAPLWLAAGAELDTNNTPHTLDELNRWYVEPPTNENGATYFLQACDVLSRDLEHHSYTNDDGEIIPQFSLPFTDLLYTNAPLSHATNAAMAPLIRRIKMAWPLFEQGARCEKSRYPIDLSKGWGTLLTYQIKVRTDVRACALLALSQSDARQEKPAGESILMILSIARSLEAEPLLVSQESRGRFLDDAVRALEQTINRVNLSNDTFDRLQKAFGDVEKRETEGASYTRAWVGQKLMISSYFDTSSNQLAKLAKQLIEPQLISNDISQIPELIAKAQKTKDSDRNQLDEMYNRVINVSKQEYPARLEIDGIMSSEISDVATRQFGFSFLANNGLNLAEQQGAVIVRLRFAQTAIALERYRARAEHENQYPESLDMLVPDYLPAVPKNIFSDPDLHYERHGHGYLLHASYPIRRSDGGTTERELTFRVTNPPGHAIIE
jgi:hypothetical protein